MKRTVKADYSHTCEGCRFLVTEPWLKDVPSFRCGADGRCKGYIVGMNGSCHTFRLGARRWARIDKEEHMKKAVLISIRPEWCQKIASGEKTIEVRKNRPKLAPPFKCYIYCTRDKHLAFMQNQTGTNLIACMDAETAIPVGGFVGNGKVIGEFTSEQIIDAWWDYVPDAITGEVTGGNLEALDGTGMTDEELFGYVGDSLRGHCYGWRICDLVIYDAPHELNSFRRVCPEELDCESCAMHSENTGRCGNEALYLRRAPQSWCYVEERHDL